MACCLRRRTSSVAALPLAVLLSLPGVVLAETPDELTFNRDIRPLLAEHCYACHGADSAARKADLRLDEREAAIDFGAIVPGQPEDSELISRVFSEDPELRMPPPETKKTLTDDEKQTLRRWIAAGAEYQPHWSLIPPGRAPLPTVRNTGWIRNSIDRFVLAELEARGLRPAAEAAPRALFRRLHLDITGLPPEPQDADAFSADYKQRGEQALSEWIDRLMSNPAWGEHRARYWLDAARYGDTHGLHFDNYREMWPYRDWVIRSFNANQPFDQFTLEQLAGDLLPNATDEQRIATGFQRCNITTNEGGTIDEENLALYAADRVQTFGWVYLGLTTNCAQCHDHKFDSFSTRDYYSLAAFFRNTTQRAKDGNVKDGRGPVLMVPLEADRARWQELPGEIAQATTARDARRQQARPDFQRWLADVTPESLGEPVADDALMVHLPLTEGRGDEVRNSCDGPATFASNGPLRWVRDGKIGPAPIMRAGGTIDLGTLGDFQQHQQFSWGAWVRAGSDRVSGGIIARMDERSAYRGWDLWQQGRGVAVHIIDAWPGNAIKVSTPNNVLTPGRWQHLFATWDGSGKPSGVKIFVDGKPVALRVEANTLKEGATIRTAVPLRVGQRSHTQVFQGGGIQDVRLYARTLSETEVRAIASVGPLRTILSRSPDLRKPAERKALYDHFLSTRDHEYPRLEQTVLALQGERDAIRGRGAVTHVQEERNDSAAMAYILTRGEYDRPGEQVTAATPASLHPMPEGAPANRLGLARWLVDPANPLTARVTVNRFWQQVFGRGIVATPEDFGIMGVLPTHPALLDWLALEFRESNWDVRHIFKLMLMSATYRQSARATEADLAADPENRFLCRGPRFRMDAEMLRDHALAVSGLLSPKMFGPSVKPYQPDNIWNMVGLPGGNTRDYVKDTGENVFRRTVYTFWKRMAPPPSLEALNAPSREVCTVRRERTNTPLQALVTLNDPQFVEAARRLAEIALLSGAASDADVLNAVARPVIGRTLQPQEQTVLLTDKQVYLGWYRDHTEQAQALIAVGDSPTNDKLDPAVLAAWTIVCNQVMNLDEALNK